MSQEESEHNEVDGMKKAVDSKGEVMQVKQSFVIFDIRALRRSALSV